MPHPTRSAPPLPPELQELVGLLALHAANTVSTVVGLGLAACLALMGFHALMLAQTRDERVASGLALLGAGITAGVASGGFFLSLARARRAGRRA